MDLPFTESAKTADAGWGGEIRSSALYLLRSRCLLDYPIETSPRQLVHKPEVQENVLTGSMNWGVISVQTGFKAKL